MPLQQCSPPSVLPQVVVLHRPLSNSPNINWEKLLHTPVFKAPYDWTNNSEKDCLLQLPHRPVRVVDLQRRKIRKSSYKTGRMASDLRGRIFGPRNHGWRGLQRSEVHITACVFFFFFFFPFFYFDLKVLEQLKRWMEQVMGKRYLADVLET